MQTTATADHTIAQAQQGAVEIVGTGDYPLRLTGTAIDINGRTARLTTAEGVRDIDLNHVLLVRENGVTTWRRSDSTALDPTRS